MRRGLIVLVTAVILAVGGGVGVGQALSATTATTVKVQQTSLGNILTNGRGFTLYVFTRDARNRDRCVAISGCRAVWPLLTTTGKPIAGRGVNPALLGSIRLPSGIRQVTYAGHPLYTYSGDFAPRSTFYVGAFQFGGFWYALRPGGKVVK
jgi:predicted lipoprotein with Yx(FWY)xxD motif